MLYDYITMLGSKNKIYHFYPKTTP